MNTVAIKVANSLIGFFISRTFFEMVKQIIYIPKLAAGGHREITEDLHLYYDKYFHIDSKHLISLSDQFPDHLPAKLRQLLMPPPMKVSQIIIIQPKKVE